MSSTWYLLIYGWVSSTYGIYIGSYAWARKKNKVVIYGLCSRSCDPFHISNIILNPHTTRVKVGWDTRVVLKLDDCSVNSKLIQEIHTHQRLECQLH